MDPGRKRNELREAQYVAVGDVIVQKGGLLWEVMSLYSAYPSVWLNVQRKHGDRTFDGNLLFERREEIMVRNYLTPNS